MHQEHPDASGARRPFDRGTGAGGDHHAGRLQPPLSSDGRRALRAGVARLDGIVHAAGGTDTVPTPLPGRGRSASGAGRADGGVIGPDRSAGCSSGPDFARLVGPNGYAWWYVDGLSDDGRFGVTIIAFIGSVFSPYYAFARRRGPADPANHVAINVALYGKGVRRWTMTERGASSLERTAGTFAVGPSRLTWSRDALEIAIDEIAVPVPTRVRGRIRLAPECLPAREFVIDRARRHVWQPIAPLARIEVNFGAQNLSWRGHAYFDHNRGTEPLDAAFKSWNWSRQQASAGKSRILYDIVPKSGPPEGLACEISRDGHLSHFEAPPQRALAGTLWRVDRETRCDDGTNASIAETLEDSPFYARSVVDSTILGVRAPSVHESLNLDRFRSSVVQAMLPFRMPRRTF